MKGIFSSHPHQALISPDGSPVRVQYLQTGQLVWTTFFNQHDIQHETIAVPPSFSTDTQFLSFGRVDYFHAEFDSVRVIHTNTYVSKTKGFQPSYSTCAQFYESKRIDVKTKG